MPTDLYEEEKVKAAEMASEELAIREGRLDVSGERPLIDLSSEELEQMSRWDPEADPNVIEDLGNGITMRKRKPRSTARRRLKAEPEGDMPVDEPEASVETKAPVKPPREPRTPPKRTKARMDLSSGLGFLLAGAGTGLVVSGRDPGVGLALQFEAPLAGEKLDQMIAGTPLDRIAQPIARAGKAGKDLGAVLALPILVALIERYPALYPVLREPVLKPMVVEMAIDLEEMGQRSKARLEAAQRKGSGKQIDADALLAMLFEGGPPPVAEDAEPAG